MHFYTIWNYFSFPVLISLAVTIAIVLICWSKKYKVSCWKSNFIRVHSYKTQNNIKLRKNWFFYNKLDCSVIWKMCCYTCKIVKLQKKIEILLDWVLAVFLVMLDTRYNKQLETLYQGSQTRGPPNVIVRPASTSKIFKYGWNCSFMWTQSTFNPFCGPQRHFFLQMRPASSYYVKMWPSYRFEFETPALYHEY